MVAADEEGGTREIQRNRVRRIVRCGPDGSARFGPKRGKDPQHPGRVQRFRG